LIGQYYCNQEVNNKRIAMPVYVESHETDSLLTAKQEV